MKVGGGGGGDAAFNKVVILYILRVGAKYFEKDLSKFQVQSQCTCT